jgi:putative phosphoesterase
MAMTRIGVISDTHGYVDPRLFELFAGVDHILHAGDIGSPGVVLQLGKIAPVTAVMGNCDLGDGFRETEVVVLGGRRFVVRHEVDVRCTEGELDTLLRRARPDVVVFGHTHRPFIERMGNVLLFNPGYGGKQRFSLPRSVGILRSDEAGISAAHLAL